MNGGNITPPPQNDQIQNMDSDEDGGMVDIPQRTDRSRSQDERRLGGGH